MTSRPVRITWLVVAATLLFGLVGFSATTADAASRQVRNAQTGRCATASSLRSTSIVLTRCRGDRTQQWSLTKVGSARQFTALRHIRNKTCVAANSRTGKVTLRSCSRKPPVVFPKNVGRGQVEFRVDLNGRSCLADRGGRMGIARCGTKAARFSRP